MSSFCFIAIEECNWDCEYCDFPLIKNPKATNMEILQKHLPYIKEIMDDLGELVVFRDISGGEIGLLPLELLQYIFTTIDAKIVISTNGLFMDKGYHLDPILRPYIDGLWVHVHQKPGNFKIDYDYHDDEIFVNKGIVHDDIQDMIDFIKMNPQIEFNYVEFEFPIGENRKMNPAMYIELLNKLKPLSNVTQGALNLIEARINEPPHLMERCRDYHQSIAIDLARERILLCHRAMDTSIPLTKENLLKRLVTPPKDLFHSDKCKSCTRLYAGKMLGNVIETFLKTKRHFEKKELI
jgi:hypothetical protein